MKRFLFILFALCIYQMVCAQEDLLNLATSYAEKGDYEKAVEYVDKAQNYYQKNYGKESAKYAEILSYKSFIFYISGQIQNAIDYANQVSILHAKINGKRSIEYAVSLNVLSTYNSVHGDYHEAVRIGTEAAQIYKDTFGIESQEYATLLNNLASWNFYLGNYQESVRLETEVMEIFCVIVGPKHPNYATSLNNLALYYSHLGNYQEAARLGVEAVIARKEVLGIKHPDYIQSLDNLAGYYCDLGNYQEAFRLESGAVKLRREVFGENHPDNAISLNSLAGIHAYMGNFREAIRLGTEALMVLRKAEVFSQLDYATVLNSLAGYNGDLGNYQEAIRLAQEAMEIRRNSQGINHPDYARSMNSLATYYLNLGKYREAIHLTTEALKIRKEVLGEKHPDYAVSLNNLALCYSCFGNYQESIRLGMEALQIQREVLGPQHLDYAVSLDNLALYNSALGNYQEAVRISSEAMKIRKVILGEKHPDYGTSLSNYASYQSEIGNYQNAIRLEKEALEIKKLFFDSKNHDYAVSLSNLAQYNSHLGYYQEAIRLGTEAMKINKEVLGYKHSSYAISLNNLAGYYSDLNNNQEAIRLVSEAKEILRITLGKEHPYYAVSMDNLANYYHYIGNKQEHDKYDREAFNLGKNLIVENFATMTPFEMNNYLEGFNYLIRERLDASVAYDALLLSKGILLTAEMGINELILESGDRAALDRFEHIRMNTLIMNKQLEKPIEERYLNVDSLSAEIEKERKLLAKQSKEFGDFTRFFSTSWQDVRDNLKTNEAAIEFGTLRQGEIQPTNHCTRALIIKYDSKEPLEIYLDLDNTKDFYENILANWQTIQNQLKGINRVYFSPSGELYSTPIENYIDDGREYIRVSSTREVVKNNYGKQSADYQMKLYGGLTYDMTMENLVEVNKAYNWSESMSTEQLYAKRSSREAVSQLYFDYLKGTLKEVTDISEIAKSSNWKCEILTGKKGTEESLRAISSKKYNLLHFATHGFYWTEEEVVDKASEKRLSFLMLHDNRAHKHEEDKAMTRSGLIFSGATLALKGEKLPAGMEDGIATAQEISRLDLRGCDLVVLSACQTGLGKISGEGVFGLQRGFKKAGVNSILMSLWEVDDLATQMLMKEFYKHYLKGESKLGALHKAQQFVKSSPGFEEPEYWAGFILLDGFD